MPSDRRQGMRNAECAQHERALSAQLDQLLASCGAGAVAGCDRAMTLPLHNLARSRIDRTRLPTCNQQAEGEETRAQGLLVTACNRRRPPRGGRVARRFSSQRWLGSP